VDGLDLPSIGSDGTVLKSTGSALGFETDTKSPEFTVDNGTSAIATGVKVCWTVPYACTITGVRLRAPRESGSIVFDLWYHATAIPTVTNTITASAKPTLTSAQIYDNATLTGWGKTMVAGGNLILNVDSCTTITNCTLSLELSKT
jgi:hypothetical protein